MKKEVKSISLIFGTSKLKRDSKNATDALLTMFEKAILQQAYFGYARHIACICNNNPVFCLLACMKK